MKTGILILTAFLTACGDCPPVPEQTAPVVSLMPIVIAPPEELPAPEPASIVICDQNITTNCSDIICSQSRIPECFISPRPAPPRTIIGEPIFVCVDDLGKEIVCRPGN